MKLFPFLISLQVLISISFGRIFKFTNVKEFKKSVALSGHSEIRLSPTDPPLSQILINVQPLLQNSDSPNAVEIKTREATSFMVQTEGYHDIKITSSDAFSGQIKISNQYGCLNGNEYPKKALLGLLTVLMFITTFAYTFYLKKNSDRIIKHHYALLILSIVATTEFFIHYSSLQHSNYFCSNSRFLQMIVVTLKTSRDIGFTVISFAMCQGWGITFSVVSNNWKMLMLKLAILICIPSFITWYAQVTVNDVTTTFSNFVKFAMGIRLFVQILLTIFMIRELLKLKRMIKSKHQMVFQHLVLFERIQIGTQFIGFCYAIHMCWSNMNSIAMHWRYEWIEMYVIWDLLFCILFITMLTIWSRISSFIAESKEGTHVLQLLSEVPSPFNFRKRSTNLQLMKTEELDLEIGSDVEIEELLQNTSEIESSIEEFDEFGLDEGLELSYKKQ